MLPQIFTTDRVTMAERKQVGIPLYSQFDNDRDIIRYRIDILYQRNKKVT